MSALAARLDALRRDLDQACRASGRDPTTVRLIAVTKTVGPAILPELATAGCLDCGENRVDHLELMAAQAPQGMRFHAIGRVQGWQLPVIARLCTTLHSLHNPGHVPRLAQACRAAGRRLEVFCQVNTSGEATKAGIAPADLAPLLEAVRAEADVLEVVGLMTMAPDLSLPGTHVDQVRAAFAALRALADQHGLPRCSMGMSGDWRLAVAEGATDIRIGSALFAALANPTAPSS